MPCLNEAETIESCVREAFVGIARLGLSGEVLVADNGSTDGSQALAEALGARVVAISTRGYGAALAGGIAAARGRWIVMGDADSSYDFSNLEPFIAQLSSGVELVMGDRFAGGIAPGAMPVLHRYLGNPVLSFLGRLFFKSDIQDFHCGLRAFNKHSIQALRLQTTGMEFASEMIVKACLLKTRIAQVPTVLRPDGRSRAPHLRTWRDGWRHLRFLLIFCPRYLFLVPGIFATGVGLLAALLVWIGPQRIGALSLDIHTMLFAAGAVLLGTQSIFFAVFTKAFGTASGLLPHDPRFARLLQFVRLETGILTGALLFVIGIGFAIASVLAWRDANFGALDPSLTMRLAIPAVFSLVQGLQIILGSFFLSILGLPRESGT